ncbi:hypothetical protein [Streptomyces sp. TRM64462]|uniref:hypothetical protein n=1 Tax=Streptomyces sp. TRM64462 TaxID=2741726 RepID=UPI001586B9A1|nr:hypothetical protein [Streptomyces sp. TRM64462]
MYRTSAAPAARVPRAAPALRLERVVHRVFPAGTSRIDDAFSVRHFTDIAGEYGRAYRPDLAAAGAGNTFASMARALVESLGPDAAEVGVAVVAHAAPDLDCRYAATTYLSEAWPHGPLAFGLSEQGGATPFTALRVATEYVRRHGLRQALVLILDQGTLPYDTEGAVPAGDAGVALLLSADEAPGVRPRVRQLPGVAPGEVRDLLAEELRPYGGDVTVVAGAGIEPGRDLPAGLAEVRETGKGFPCTALWAHLAGEGPAGLPARLTAGRPAGEGPAGEPAGLSAGLPAGRPLVLAEYDPVGADFGVCVVEPEAAPVPLQGWEAVR